MKVKEIWHLCQQWSQRDRGTLTKSSNSDMKTTFKICLRCSGAIVVAVILATDIFRRRLEHRTQGNRVSQRDTYTFLRYIMLH